MLVIKPESASTAASVIQNAPILPGTEDALEKWLELNAAFSVSDQTSHPKKSLAADVRERNANEPD